MDLATFNWWAVLLATALGFLLGGLWYGPLFGNAWLTAMGKTAEDIEPSPSPFIISFFTALITAIALAWLVQALVITTLTGGLMLGLGVGMAFIATAMASDSAFCGWGVRLFVIQAGYRVTYSVLMGGVLAVWQ